MRATGGQTRQSRYEQKASHDKYLRQNLRKSGLAKAVGLENSTFGMPLCKGLPSRFGNLWQKRFTQSEKLLHSA